MTVSPSRIIAGTSRTEEVYNDFQREILSEKAASLGRTGKKLEETLAALSRAGDDDGREALVQAAADAAHAYLIQREAAGILSLGSPLEDSDMPGDVRVRIGVRPRRTA